MFNVFLSRQLRGVIGKKGVSAVVATVLIIMITVAAVGVVWAVIIPMIQNNLGNSLCDDVDISIGTTQGFTCYDSTKKIVAVQIKKGPNDVDVSGVDFILSSVGNSYSENMSYSFTSNEYHTFYIDAATLGNIDSVSVAPVLKTGKLCRTLSLDYLPPCSLGDVALINDPWTPVFSNYKDNSGSFFYEGTGEFNVTVANTNGTVYLEINGTKVLANLVDGVYIATYSLSAQGTYSYKWSSFGNGTTNKSAVSDVKNYIINSAFAGGDGSLGDPYQIETWTQLDRVRDYLDSNFILNNDLTSSDDDYAGIGGDFSSIGGCGAIVQEGCDVPNCLSLDGTQDPFTGNFNGSNFVIEGLVVWGYSAGTGLFGYSTGSISNVKLSSVGVSGAGTCNSVGSFVGGLVGFNEGPISNSYVEGVVTSEPLRYSSGAGYGSYVGGLVGYNYGGSITDSSSSANLSGDTYVGGLAGSSSGTINNSYATGEVTGNENIGGLIGYSEGSISNSYSTGSVDGVTIIGGLVGTQYIGSISNSYATGTVTASSGPAGGLVGDGNGLINNSYSTGTVAGYYSGGLIGIQQGGDIINSYAAGQVVLDYYAGGLTTYKYGGTITNFFWDMNASEQTIMCAVISGGTGCDDSYGKTTEEMKNPNTFSSVWDTNVWNLTEGQYPKLVWQN